MSKSSTESPGRPLPLRGLAAALWWLARQVAPPEARSQFVREWTAEIAHLAGRLPQRQPDWRAVARAALSDALWLRRHRNGAAPPLSSRLVDAGPLPIDLYSPATNTLGIGGSAMHRLALALKVCRRRLQRSPLFGALFVLLLASGIAAAATVYTVAHHVVFAPLSYHQPERLVRLLLRDREGKLDWTSWAQFERVDSNSSFESVATSTTFPGTWRSPEGLERIQRSFVSAGYFETLGVQAQEGRLFEGTAGEDGEAADAGGQVVLTAGFWRSRLAGDPAVVGTSLEVDGRPRTVVGVAPARLYGHDLGNKGTQLYLIQPAAMSARNPHFRVYTLFARLREGQTEAAAEAELVRATASLAEERPEAYRGFSVKVEPLQDSLLGETGRTLRLLLAAVIALLVIVALNLAGLMASRALSRARESALHLAMGAGRGAAAAHALIEGVALSLLGGLGGIALTAVALRTILSASPGLPRLGEVSWGGPTIAFALLLTLGATTIVLVATLFLTRTRQPFLLLRVGAPSASSHRLLLRSLLISTQVALAVPLVLGACLLVRSLFELRGRELGLEPDGVYATRISRPPSRSRDLADNARFFGEVLERVRAVPGVLEAGGGLYAPLVVEEADRTRFAIEGQPEVADDEAPRALMQIASIGFFEALGTRVIAGRPFEPRDHIDSPPVAIVNRELVRRVLADTDPLGRRLEIELELIPGNALVREIVGVVEDQAQLGPLAENEPMIYLPHGQTPWHSMAVVLRSPLDSGALGPTLRSAVLGLDSEAIVEPLVTLSSALDGALARPRGLARLLLAFAVAATVISALGLYAGLSLQVAQRGREIGLRMALGATRADVAGLFLRRGLLLTVAGLLPGGLLAIGLRRLLASHVHGTSTADPLAIGATLTALAVTGLLASWLPARRASRCDPRESLHLEGG